MKRYVAWYLEPSGHWCSCGVIKARTPAGALAQFAREIRKIDPNCTSIRVTRKPA